MTPNEKRITEDFMHMARSREDWLKACDIKHGVILEALKLLDDNKVEEAKTALAKGL